MVYNCTYLHTLTSVHSRPPTHAHSRARTHTHTHTHTPTGHLPVELNMKAVPKDVYKYSNAPPPPIPSRAPIVTTNSPAKSKTLPPSRPPKS